MIPKKIHYCWVGGNPIPESGKKCIESWRRYCPDYEIIEWNESNLDIGSVRYMREAYEKKAWGFVPDVARLQIIYREGGIYLDTDVELLRPLDDLLKNHAFMGFQSPEWVALGLGFGAEPGNELIHRFLQDYEKRSFVNADGSLNRTSSPTIQTRLLKTLGLKTDGSMQTIMGAVIYPPRYFCPISYESGKMDITKDTYSIHHYDGSWLTPKERKFDERRMKVMHIFGDHIGRVIWSGVRFFRMVGRKGLRTSIQMTWQRLRERIKERRGTDSTAKYGNGQRIDSGTEKKTEHR